jgi:hypothetical protein
MLCESYIHNEIAATSVSTKTWPVVFTELSHESLAGAEIPTSSDNKGNCTNWTQSVFCQTHTSSHGSFQ